MTIDFPRETASLRRLWKLAFGDEDAFLDAFFTLAFSQERCLCAREGEDLAGMLFWLDGSCGGQKMAYLYAVATDPAWRGRGICRTLLEQTKLLLRQRGYAGALLVPGSPQLRQMYEKMGWQTVTTVSELRCGPGEAAAALRPVDGQTYARLRRKYLPQQSVLQEHENLAFLASQEQLYAGEDFLLACHREEDRLIGPELLGNSAAAPGIVTALGAGAGIFRTPGTALPFAMGTALTPDCPIPSYFGLAFD